MRTRKSLFGRKQQGCRSERRLARIRGLDAPAEVELLEDRALLATVLYQTPIDVNVSTEPSRTQAISRVGVAENGDFVVAWEDVFSLSETNIAFRRFNADGTPKEETRFAASSATADERSVDIAVASPGGFVLVWQQFDAASSTYDIYFARYNNAGTQVIAPTRANVNTTGHQIDPTVEIADDGSFVIAWVDQGTDANGDIAYRRFFGTGVAKDPTDVFVASSASIGEIEPDLGMNKTNGTFVIVWTEDELPTDRDVWFQVRTSAGVAVNAPTRAHVTDNGLNDFQDRGSVAMDNDGEFIITWEDFNNVAAPHNDVLFRRFTATGAAKDLVDRTVVATAEEEGDAVVAVNGDGTRFVIAYEVGPQGSSEVIQFKVFDENGNLVNGPSGVRGNEPVADVGVGMNAVGDFAVSYSLVGNVFAIGATKFNLVSSAEVVVGAGPGGGPAVRVFDTQTGQMTRFFFAYTRQFFGGIAVATGDVNGDGFPEIITGPGREAGPLVRVWDGASGAMLNQFFAYGQAFRGGIFVAMGDVDNDGIPEVITAPRAGGGRASRCSTR